MNKLPKHHAYALYFSKYKILGQNDLRGYLIKLTPSTRLIEMSSTNKIIFI